MTGSPWTLTAGSVMLSERAKTCSRPGLSVRERASVQVPVKWALLPLFVSVRSTFPHGCKKYKKCPFYRGLHACTLSKSLSRREGAYGPPKRGS
jgi:hypothetical protein